MTIKSIKERLEEMKQLFVSRQNFEMGRITRDTIDLADVVASLQSEVEKLKAAKSVSYDEGVGVSLAEIAETARKAANATNAANEACRIAAGRHVASTPEPQPSGDSGQFIVPDPQPDRVIDDKTSYKVEPPNTLYETDQPIEPQPVADVGEGYRVPTMDDVGKEVEVRNFPLLSWDKRRLVQVETSAYGNFICASRGDTYHWRYARIACDPVKPAREPRECIGTEDHDGGWQVNVQEFASGSRTTTNPAKYKRVIKFREVIE